MSNVAQRRARAATRVEEEATSLLQLAEAYADSVSDSMRRMYRSREILRSARGYAAAVRNLARLRA